MQRKNFIPRNEGFTCEDCGTSVPAAQGTFRNHCPKCLTSKHVDLITPGDRANTCHGLMRTVQVEGTNPDNLDLVQTCEYCGHTARNRIAPDDDKDAVFLIMSNRT